MSEEIIKKTIDFLISRADPSKGLSLVLWGGEPLLHANHLRLAVKYAHQLATSKRVRLAFATTTNCTLLTKSMADFLISYRVVINLSLDGSRQIHDLNRTYKNGLGSFDSVLPNVKYFVDACRLRFPEYVPRARMTVTHQSVPAFYESHIELWRLGVPVVWSKDVDWLPDESPMALTEADFLVLRDQYEQLRDCILAESSSPCPTFLDQQLWWDLHELHQRIGKRQACSAGLAGLSIDTNGDILTCYHLSQYGAEYRLGNVLGPQATSNQIHAVAPRFVDDISGCEECPFKFRCGGGCFAKGIFHNHTRFECWAGQCQFIKMYNEHCLRLYARLMFSTSAERIRNILNCREVAGPELETAYC